VYAHTRPVQSRNVPGFFSSYVLTFVKGAFGFPHAVIRLWGYNGWKFDCLGGGLTLADGMQKQPASLAPEKLD
jgi:hypothetical protein